MRAYLFTEFVIPARVNLFLLAQIHEIPLCDIYLDNFAKMKTCFTLIGAAIPRVVRYAFVKRVGPGHSGKISRSANSLTINYRVVPREPSLMTSEAVIISGYYSQQPITSVISARPSSRLSPLRAIGARLIAAPLRSAFRGFRSALRLRGGTSERFSRAACYRRYNPPINRPD